MQLTYSEIVQLCARVGIPVRRSVLEDCYAKSNGSIYLSVFGVFNQFILAHELTHAVGDILNRPSFARRLQYYSVHGSGKGIPKYCHRVIIEEAICDRVAEILTDKTRASYLKSDPDMVLGAYPPVQPNSLSENYVKIKTAETLRFLLPHIKKVQNVARHAEASLGTSSSR